MAYPLPPKPSSLASVTHTESISYVVCHHLAYPPMWSSVIIWQNPPAPNMTTSFVNNPYSLHYSTQKTDQFRKLGKYPVGRCMRTHSPFTHYHAKRAAKYPYVTACSRNTNLISHGSISNILSRIPEFCLFWNKPEWDPFSFIPQRILHHDCNISEDNRKEEDTRRIPDILFIFCTVLSVLYLLSVKKNRNGTHFLLYPDYSSIIINVTFL